MQNIRQQKFLSRSPTDKRNKERYDGYKSGKWQQLICNYKDQRSNNTEILQKPHKKNTIGHSLKKNIVSKNFKMPKQAKQYNTEKLIQNIEQKNVKFMQETSSTEYGHKYYQRSRLFSDLKNFPVHAMSPRKKISIAPRKSISGQNFDVLKKLGAGKYGNVYLVKDRITGFVLALKSISKSLIKAKDVQEQIIREIKIQSYLKHQGIIQLYGVFDDFQNIYMLMELGCHGQLYELLQNKKQGNIKQQSASFVAKKLLTALQFIHEEHIIHRDLKPENIVLIFGHPKICDFGWAVYHNEAVEWKMRETFCGTPLYFSPQLLIGKGYDKKTDLWAIGVMIYEFVTGSSPFGLKNAEDIRKIVTDDVQSLHKLSRRLYQFICLALDKNPKTRGCCNSLLSTKFIKDYSEMEICEQLSRN